MQSRTWIRGLVVGTVTTLTVTGMTVAGAADGGSPSRPPLAAELVPAAAVRQQADEQAAARSTVAEHRMRVRAAERAAAEKAAREKAAREKAAREKAAREKAARERARERAARAAARRPVSSGDARATAQAMVAERGWSDGQFSCLDSLWQKESGWKVTADNPTSSAYGIPQALPGSKMASAGSDWRTNAATQIRWGLGYIADVYGTPCSAWEHSQANNWY